MFLDSLVEDVAWCALHAIDKDGKPIPFDLIEEEIKATHPFSVRKFRLMLSVPFFEKAPCELSDDEISTARIQEIADETEKKIQGGLGSRPLLSVPHIVSDEASCCYHSHVLAEMSVHQTRECFMKRDGHVADNPDVGPTLTKACWEFGNSRTFLDLVKDLTGKELSGGPWVAELKQDVDSRTKSEKDEHEKALLQKSDSSEEKIDLNMTVRFVDGDNVISDSSGEGGVIGACKKFEAFVNERISIKEQQGS